MFNITNDNYKKEVVASTDPVVIVFGANWCTPCKSLHITLNSIKDNFPNVKFVSIDVDAETDITAKYQIFSVPTLVLVQNNKEIGRMVGNNHGKFIEDWIVAKL